VYISTTRKREREILLPRERITLLVPSSISLCGHQFLPMRDIADKSQTIKEKKQEEEEEEEIV
jgi:hypothetical protein